MGSELMKKQKNKENVKGKNKNSENAYADYPILKRDFIYLTERERKLQQCIPSEHGLASGTKECAQPEVAKGTSNLTLTDDMKKAGVTWINKTNEKADFDLKEEKNKLEQCIPWEYTFKSKLSLDYPMADPEKYLKFNNSWQKNIDPVFAGRLAALASDFARDYNLKFHIRSGYRIYEEQVKSYMKSGGYQDENGKWVGGDRTAAKPGHSWHNYGEAVDIERYEKYEKDSAWLRRLEFNESVFKQEILNKYGLCKPLYKGNPSKIEENWHIQPIETVKDRNKQSYLEEYISNNDDRKNHSIPKCMQPQVGNRDVQFYVDRFEVAYYDPYYRIIRITSFSKWLRVRYKDGTIIDINIDDISEKRPDGSTVLEQMSHAHTGEGGRIFPEKMNVATTPRLVEAKRRVIEEMDNNFNADFLRKVDATTIIQIIVQGGTSTVIPLPKTTPRLASVRQRKTHSAAKEIAPAAGSVRKDEGAKGLIGKDFEDFPVKRLGGKGRFKVKSREIDGCDWKRF